MPSTVNERKDGLLSIQTTHNGTDNDTSSDLNDSVEIPLESYTMTSQKSEYQSETKTADQQEAGETAALAQQEDQRKRRKTPLSTVTDGVASFFPKVEPLKFKTFLTLTLLISLPSAFYIANFTKVGYGLTTFYYLSEHYEKYAPVLGALVAMFLFVLYLLDFTDWKSTTGKIFRTLSIALISLGCMFTVLFYTGKHPYGPIAVYTIFTPIWLGWTKQIFYPRKAMKTYIQWHGGPLLFVSFVILTMWIIWILIAEDHEWNDVMRLADAEESGCHPDFTKHQECRAPGTDDKVCFIVDAKNNDILFPKGCPSNCTEVYQNCSNTFILWVGPLLVSISLIFTSFFTTFFKADTGQSDMVQFAKLWMALLFAMWVTASLAGAGAGVSTTLTAMTLASFIASAIFMASMWSRSEQKMYVKQMWQKIHDKFGNYLDVLRGLFIVTCAPILVLYLCLSVLNQLVRRSEIFPCTKKTQQWHNDEEEVPANTWLTKKTYKQVQIFRSWSRVKVFTYAIYWGIFFMTLNVLVSKFTILFLSWLIQKTSTMNLGTVTAILCGVGMIMFLLPPVPGVPIYLTLGIVVVAVGRKSLGFAGSVFYSIGVSLLLKLLACTAQQKLIGETLKGYVSVRRAVGVNTSLIRSMKVVLAENGFSVAKVSILVGGPDWPTSVLCGIMGLPLIPILMGTLPVAFLIAPTVLTGSFTYLSSLKDDMGVPEYPWAGTVATMSAAVTAVVQFGSMVVAALYLERATVENKEKLESMEYDQQVLEGDEAVEERNKAYEDVTQWYTLPLWPKLVLYVSLILMITCCYTVQILQDSCFAEYALTYTIQKDLNGNWLNLVKPLGRVAILFFIISICLLKIFTFYATRKATQLMRGSSISPEQQTTLPLTHPGSDGEIEHASPTNNIAAIAGIAAMPVPLSVA